MSNQQGGKGQARPHWRFEDLEIWKASRDLAVQFHRIAQKLDARKFYRYAEQLRAAGLSLSNNIAEGSGSGHKQEFIQFLNIAGDRCLRIHLCESSSRTSGCWKVQKLMNCFGRVIH